MEFKNTTTENRKRSANFTFNEELVLMCLAKKYRKIIELKLTDSKCQKEKLKCWTKIECEFNAESGEHFRNSLVLKKKYDNIKKQTKKKIVEEINRKYSCTTTSTPSSGNNSPSSTSGFSEIELKMKELLDNINKVVNDDGKVSEFNAVGFENGLDDNNSLELSSDEEGQKQLRRPSSATNLPTVTANNHTNVWSKEIPEYPDSAREGETFHVENQKYQYLFEEHRLKINLMKKRHDQELQIIRQKADLELFCIRQEHEIKMKILREQKNLNSSQIN